MYALAVVPLIRHLRSAAPEVSQAWFADDATAFGSLMKLLSWWQLLSSVGPAYGYFTNAIKTVLIVKPEHLSIVQAIFADSKIQITSRGQWHLGAALGGQENLLKNTWLQRFNPGLLRFLGIVQSRPHATYCEFTHSMMGRWVYLMRTIPNIGSLLQPLEDAIRLHTACNTDERELFSLPWGLGMGDDF